MAKEPTLPAGHEAPPDLNPEHAGKFTWTEGDLEVYETEADYRAAMLDAEIARTDKLLKEAGVDPDNPEASLGNLDEDDE